MKSFTKTLFFLSVIFLLACPLAPVLADEETQALEITYPTFTGKDGKVIKLDGESGLPQYVKYVFRFALALVGFIILYSMVNNGLGYILSAGNAEKLLTAKQGITSAFVGALVLIGAVILFNTINPDLKNLNNPDLTEVEGFVQPGIYLCNYAPDIKDDLETYLKIVDEKGKEEVKKKIREERGKAVLAIKDAMKNKNGTCYRANFSGNLDYSDLPVSKKSNGELFMIPERTYKIEDQPGSKDDWDFEYGIIFHEGRNQTKSCSFGKGVRNVLSFENISSPFIKSFTNILNIMDFDTVKSITVFQKPEKDIPTSIGVTLFQCLNYNKDNLCPKGVETPKNVGWGLLKGDYIRGIDHSNLGDYLTAPESYGTEKKKKGGTGQNLSGTTLYYDSPTYSEEEKRKGTRSITIKDDFFAVLFSGNALNGGICETIDKNDNNLLDQPIGRCGESCRGVFSQEEVFLRDCLPCLRSMIVIKGNILY